VISWQRANGFPISFVTEASLDLADDDELMRLMVDAGIEAVFVGIESTSEESLREAKKLQNVRGSDSMVDKVRRIQAAGMEVWAGMILGFDNDDKTAFEAQKRFLQSARINTAMIGMLAALPKTPLHARLAAAGRLDSADTPAHGTNVIPLRMSRNELSEGYVRLMVAVYDWRTYFARLDDLYVDGGLEIDRAWQQYATRHPWRRRARHARFLLEAFGILLRLMARVPDYSLRSVYRHQFLHLLCARRNPAVLRVYAIKCAVHFHMHTFAGGRVQDPKTRFQILDCWKRPGGDSVHTLCFSAAQASWLYRCSLCSTRSEDLLDAIALRAAPSDHCDRNGRARAGPPTEVRCMQRGETLRPRNWHCRVNSNGVLESGVGCVGKIALPINATLTDTPPPGLRISAVFRSRFSPGLFYFCVHAAYCTETIGPHMRAARPQLSRRGGLEVRASPPRMPNSY
jgi:Domain of unknown function (DUF4070)